MQPEIKLLGTPAVRDARGEPVGAAAWRTTKTFDLVRVLALSAGQAVPIDTLLDQFWPTAGAARAGASLRTATCQIRRVLGNDCVVREGQGLVLDAWTDVAAYRALARRIEDTREKSHPAYVVSLVREAERLYVGDLEVSGSDCAELHAVRTELRELRVQVLLEGAVAAGRCADWQQSLAFAKRAVVIETSDRVTRALMRAWFAVGETAKPIEEFERLRRHLAEEYGADPAPQTRALFLEVVSVCAEWPPRQSIVGREREIREVVTAAMGWLMDPDGGSGVVWLVGHPGAGREAVAREAARTLRLPVADERTDPGESATLELLSDQGTLTKGLAATLQQRARLRRRILLVPVSEVAASTLDDADAVVAIPPLEREDIRRLAGLVLQAEPGDGLTDELLQASGGLPGLAARTARRRLDVGDLQWTTRGVDTARKLRLRTRALPALAIIPFALFGLFGGPASGPGELSAERERTLVVEERVRPLRLAV